MIKKIYFLIISILVVKNSKNSNNCDALTKLDPKYVCFSKNNIYSHDHIKFFNIYKDREEYFAMEVKGKTHLSKNLKSEFSFDLTKKLESDDLTFYLFEFNNKFISLEKMISNHWANYIYILKNIIVGLEYFREHSIGDIRLNKKNIFVNLENFSIRFLFIGSANLEKSHLSLEKLHTLNEFKDLYNYLLTKYDIEKQAHFSNKSKLKLVTFKDTINEYIMGLSEQSFIYKDVITFLDGKINMIKKLNGQMIDKDYSQVIKESVSHIRIFFILVLFAFFIVLASFTVNLIVKRKKETTKDDFTFEEERVVDDEKFKKLFK